MALLTADRPNQHAHIARLHERCVLRPDDIQRAFQIGSHVAFDNPARYREAKYLAADLLDPARGLAHVTRFHSAQACQHIRRSQGINGHLADVRADVALEVDVHLALRCRRPAASGLL